MISHTIAVVAGLYALRLLNREMRILFLYCGVALLADLIGVYLAKQSINNLWLVRVFTIVEYGFFIAFFSTLQPSQVLKRILVLSIPLITALGFFEMLFTESSRQFDSFSAPVAYLILVGASAYTLFGMSMESNISIIQQPRFWVASAALIYFASTLVLFSLGNMLLDWPLESVRLVFTFHALINIIANLGYSGGFLCLVQAQKSGGH